MGTNYYFYLTDKDVAHSYFATKEEYGVFDEEYKLIDDPYFCYKIHLNKCSCGWRTLFQEHKCFSSFKELEHFYHEHKDCIRIFDEYGEEFTWEKYKDEVISRNYIDKKPMKWVYEENEWCGRPGVKYLDTKECAEEEAELYLPFDHCGYNRTKQIAKQKFCPYDERYSLHVEYWNDPDYPVDWTEGEFS